MTWFDTTWPFRFPVYHTVWAVKGTRLPWSTPLPFETEFPRTHLSVLELFVSHSLTTSTRAPDDPPPYLWAPGADGNQKWSFHG